MGMGSDGMRGFSIAALAAALVGLVLPVQALAGPAAMTVVCHVQGNGTFLSVEVADAAVMPAHLGHGDGLVGDTVPGMDGYVFGEGCVAELAAPVPGCYEHDTDEFLDLEYLGPVDTIGNIHRSATTDGSCSEPVPRGLALVVADDAGAAETKCNDLNGSLHPILGEASLFDFGWAGFPPNAWLCQPV